MSQYTQQPQRAQRTVRLPSTRTFMCGRAVNERRDHRLVIALIPARNEERDIGTTLNALAAQTRLPDRVIVIANNCTDDTADAARRHGVEVVELRRNTGKKAGALNAALYQLLPWLADDDMILVQDADSYLDPGFIAACEAKIRAGYSAAGGNFRARPGGGFVGWCQRNEYARYARDNARKSGRVLCITGVGTLFTVRALRDIAAGMRDGRLPWDGRSYIYCETSLTEDNWMTHALRRLGHKFVSPKDATMSTEPMLTWRDLARQRRRWKRGAFEDLITFGVNRHTAKGWGLFLVSCLGMLVTATYLATLAACVWTGFHPIWWLVSMLTGIYLVERVVTARERGRGTQLLAATVFPEWCYDVFLQGVQAGAITSSLVGLRKEW